MNIVTDRRRALAVAMILLGAGLVGYVVGPTGVGVLNDLLARRFGELAIRYSLLLTAATPFVAALRFLARDGALSALCHPAH